MMHGHEKSDLVIVALKPANKAKEAYCGGGRSGVGGAKGGGQGEYAPAQHVLDSEPGSRAKRAGAYTATFAVTHPRQEPYAGKPHVRIWAGGVRRNARPYRYGGARSSRCSAARRSRGRSGRGRSNRCAPPSPALNISTSGSQPWVGVPAMRRGAAVAASVALAAAWGPPQRWRDT